ncbi:MAG: hypothetical protein JWO19_2617 [Bryobacterales bacterium]|nr:hypothetical protein [Bryobacterales bacterium]
MLRSIAVVVCITAPGLIAQESGRFTFEGRVQGSVNSLGSVTRLDTSAGYLLTRHWSLSLGVPYYFVNPSSSTQASNGTSSFNGVGNVFSELRFARPNRVVNYVSTVTGTAPTGDRDKGLSTGHATVDWSNYFERSFGSLTPFGEVGIANAVSDTQFFVRPYTSYGLVTHVQGGARYRLARWMNVGGSAYLIQPSGQQTVTSRVVTKRGPLAAAVPGAARGLLKQVFETQSTTTGTADIARDHGFSTWATVGVRPSFNVYAGYTRSTQYRLDTVFFGVGFRIRHSLGIGGL